MANSNTGGTNKYIDGHFQIGLPFRREDIQLPDNKYQALKRLKSLKRRMIDNPEFHSDYKTFMKSIIDNGYAEQVGNEQLSGEPGRVWHIPHHGVYHPKKPDKIRVVFDCAAKCQGVSLNDLLLQGPNLTNNLVGVLLRFREENIAIMADIEAMFHQVRVPEQDSDCLRFLWWPDGNIDAEPETYKMVVHLFGAVSSPTCANVALRNAADACKDSFDPEIVETVYRNFYVDDCLKSTASEAKAIHLVHGLRELCQHGGFRLTKWVSNSRTVLESIPEAERAKDIKNLDLESNDLPVERALGVYWSVENDTLGFKICIQSRPPTKRGILSVISSVYDPLGLAAPCVLPARILLQDLCQRNTDWDTEIEDKDLQAWKRWLADLPRLEQLSVQRCFKPVNFGKVISSQIHTFCDASERGYGAVSYMRSVNEEGRIHNSIIMGKSRVAPMKKITIPRMELTAATVAVRLTTLITKELDMPVSDIYYWTDSMSVIRYIKNESAIFHTFVANRIAVIRDGSNVENWNYVASKLNPADEASRGLTVNEFVANKRWLEGPEFLWRPQEEWPKANVKIGGILENDPEVRVQVNTVVERKESSPTDRLLAYFSNWLTLTKTVGWILRAMKSLRQWAVRRKDLLESVRNQDIETEKQEALVNEKMRKIKLQALAQSKENVKMVSLSTEDLQKAENGILKYVQRSNFSEEINVLQSGDQNIRLKRDSRIRKLNPIMKDGLLCVGGRLDRAALSCEAKYPVILPKESMVSTLILYDIHKSVGHLGRNSMLAKLRERFWILSANTLIRSIVSRCVTCQRYQGQRGAQIMADLPADRITPHEPPFTRSGVDYFGPIEVKRGRSMVKRYGAIFTCLAIRAVHIELAYSLNTDSCINAMRRFIARRGQAKVIRSDNGTNFVGAERELKEEVDNWNQKKIADALYVKNVIWKFNPPSASHFGGIWERQIRTIRKVLYSLLRDQTVTLDDESLQTLFCEVESIINSRPITRMSNDCNDLDALTPNHLLLLQSTVNPPPGIFCKEDNYVRRRWRHVQYLADIFWKRWLNEYLPALHERQKWLRPVKNLKLGDIVLIVDNTAPRNTWNMGRIVEIHADRNGVVRVVKVKTKTNILERPIHKLCVILEADIE